MKMAILIMLVLLSIVSLFLSEKIDWFLSNWKKIYLEHIKPITFFVLLASIGFPLLVLVLIRMINQYPNWLGGVAYLEDGISVWLSFWGSYVGAIATILIALITLRLTLKNDISAKDSELNELALKFHRFEVKNIHLYDLEECFPVEELEHFDSYINGRYLIKIEFGQPFPPYFDIQLKKFEWGKMCGNEVVYSPMKCVTEYESNKNFIMLFLLNSDNDMGTINELYYINYFEPLVMLKHERRHWIRIGIQCENKMYAVEHDKNENNMELQIEVEFENISDYQKKYVKLKPTKRKISHCQFVV